MARRLYIGNNLVGLNTTLLSLDADAETKAIKDSSGNTLTYSQIYTLISNKNLFVVLVVSESVMCYPAYYDETAIEFTNTYKRDGKTYFNRVIINSDNEVLYEELEGSVQVITPNAVGTTSAILSTIGIGETKYSVGDKLYEHFLKFTTFTIVLVNRVATAYTSMSASTLSSILNWRSDMRVAGCAIQARINPQSTGYQTYQIVGYTLYSTLSQGLIFYGGASITQFTYNEGEATFTSDTVYEY